jgi:hypothetical protein
MSMGDPKHVIPRTASKMASPFKSAYPITFASVIDAPPKDPSDNHDSP